MEKILEEQSNVGMEIQRLYHEAQSASPEWAEEKILNLKAQIMLKMENFEANHLRLEKEKKALKGEKYFTDHMREKVLTLRDASIVRLETLLQSLKPGKLKSASDVDIKYVEEKIVSGKKVDGTLRKFQYALSDFEQKINDFRENKCDLEELKQAKNSAQTIFYEYIENNPDDELVEGFYDLKELYEKLPKDQRREEIQFPLPSIDIPIFDGDYSKWDTFKELFQQLVAGRNIPNIQKMCILKSKLRGDAASCIFNLPATSTNFNTAWEILEQQFSNKRMVANSYLKRIFDAPHVEENEHSVKRFLRMIKESTQALNNLQLSAEDMNEAILSFVLLRKLQDNMRLKFELSLKNSREIPKLSNILSFLEHEFTALESVPKSIESSPMRVEVKNRSTQQRTKKCVMECKIFHSLNQCSKFRALPVNERWAKVVANKLCIKCLNGGHLSRNCTALTCKVCKKNHHAMLHNQSQEGEMEKSATVQQNEGVDTDQCILLSTAIIKIKGMNGKFVKARALLDSGSQVCLMTRARTLWKLPIFSLTSESKSLLI